MNTYIRVLPVGFNKEFHDMQQSATHNNRAHRVRQSKALSNFSNVSSIGVLNSKFTSNLTFENCYLSFAPTRPTALENAGAREITWAHKKEGERERVRVREEKQRARREREGGMSA